MTNAANIPMLSFFIDKHEITEAQYGAALSQTGLILANTNTLIIDSASIGYIAMKHDRKLSNFVEFFATDRTLIEMYKNKTKIHEKMKADLTATIKQHTEITVEKKKMAKKRADDDKRNDLVDRLESELERFKLFRQYHNEQLLEKIDGESEVKLGELNALKLTNNAAIERLREHQNELKSAEIDCEAPRHEFAEFCDDNVESTMKFLVEYKVHSNMKERKNVVKELETHLSDQSALDEAENECQQLETIISQKDDGETATSNLIQLRIDQELNENAEIDSFLYSNDFMQILKKNADIAKENSVSDEIIDANRAEVDELKAAKVEKFAEIEENVKLFQQRKKLSQNLNNLTKSIEKFLQKSRISNSIVDELKMLFPGCVHGRLNDTIDTDDSNFSKLLGSFINAIVVDSKRTAKKCLDLLTLRQIQPTHETFLILDEIHESKSLANLLAAELIPQFREAFITNFIRSSNEELQKALMFCVKPSLVANSLDDVDKLLTVQELKRLDLVDASSSCVFTKQGRVKVMHSSGGNELDEITDENVMQMIERESTLRLELMKMEFAIKPQMLQNVDDKIELNKISKSIFDAEKSLEVKMRMKNESEYYTGKFAFIMNIEEQVKRNFDAFEITQNAFNEQNGDLITSCSKFQIASVQLDKLKKKIQQQKTENMENTRIAEELKVDDQEIKDLTKQLKAQRKLLDHSSNTEFESKLDAYQEQSQKLTESLKLVANSTIEFGDNVNAIFHAYDNLLKNEHQKYSAMNENYRSVKDTFNNYQTVDLVAGSMKEILTLPAKIPAEFDLVESQMQNVRIKSDKLKNALKNADINVHQTTIDFEKKLQKLQTEIDKPKRINVDVNESRLQQKEKDLKELETKINSQKKKMQSAESQLSELITERRRNFLGCIATINVGIAEFCDLICADGAQGKLVADNVDEPYLSGLTFHWPTSDNPENIINEFDFSHLAAFALLWGILKFKQQKFVILNDATMKICENLERFFNHQRQLQVVSFTSKLSDDDAKYFVNSKAGTYVVKEM